MPRTHTYVHIYIHIATLRLRAYVSGTASRVDLCAGQVFIALRRPNLPRRSVAVLQRGAMAAHLPGPANRRRQASVELASVRAELAKVRRRERAVERREARQWNPEGVVANTALSIYVLAGYSVEPAVRYLRTCALERHWPPKSEEVLETFLMDCFLAKDPLRLAEQVEDPGDVEPMRVAQRYVLEWRAVEWARGRVLGPRIPPPSALVMQQYEEARLSVPEDVRPGPCGAGGVGSAKSWIRRLRRRWGGRHGNLRVRDEPHADVLQAKARDWGMFVGRALVAVRAVRWVERGRGIRWAGRAGSVRDSAGETRPCGMQEARPQWPSGPVIPRAFSARESTAGSAR